MFWRKEKKSKVAVYVDGNNVYFKLKDLNLKNLVGFNYRGLTDMLVAGREAISLRYYKSDFLTCRVWVCKNTPAVQNYWAWRN